MRKVLFICMLALAFPGLCQTLDFNQFISLTKINDIDKLGEVMESMGYFRAPDKVASSNYADAMWGYGGIRFDAETGQSQFNNSRSNHEFLFNHVMDENYLWMYVSNMINFDDMRECAVSQGWEKTSTEQKNNGVKYKYKKKGSNHTLYIIQYNTGRNALLYQTY